VIYNNRMPGSKLVADHYAQMRQVPEAQVYGFDLPITEEMTRAEFGDALQFPLASRLVVDKLWRFGSVTNAATNGQPKRVENRVVESKIRLRGPLLRRSAENRRRPEFARAGPGKRPSGVFCATRRRWIPSWPGCRC